MKFPGLPVLMLRAAFGNSDRKRDAGLKTPGSVQRTNDLHYGPNKKWNAFDLYRPKNAGGKLPVIVSFHGGGYVYGDKEVYQFYCMDLADRGFAVVNFNYTLAPDAGFPQPLEEMNMLMRWLCAHAAECALDMDNVFLVGDSAGAQMASQYAVMWANPAYAALFGTEVPAFRLAAVCLNCGMYDLREKNVLSGAIKSYFAPVAKTPDDERLNVLAYIDGNFPPAYVMSAANDFLLDRCEPMAELLRTRGVETVCKIYGDKDDPNAGHVFHCNIRLPLAKACNDDEAAFMRRFIR